MSVLVNYHMDTFFGIGYRSEHLHVGYPCTGGYVYTERGGGNIIWGILYMVNIHMQVETMILDE